MATYSDVRETLNKNCIDDKVNKAIDFCKNQNIKFVDKQFPPNQASLFQSPPHSEYKGQWNSMKWARAEEIFGPRNYDVFRDIDPCDIKQGSLGNCYFLCSLSSLAEQDRKSVV